MYCKVNLTWQQAVLSALLMSSAVSANYPNRNGQRLNNAVRAVEKSDGKSVDAVLAEVNGAQNGGPAAGTVDTTAVGNQDGAQGADAQDGADVEQEGDNQDAGDLPDPVAASTAGIAVPPATAGAAEANGGQQGADTKGVAAGQELVDAGSAAAAAPPAPAAAANATATAGKKAKGDKKAKAAAKKATKDAAKQAKATGAAGAAGAVNAGLAAASANPTAPPAAPAANPAADPAADPNGKAAKKNKADDTQGATAAGGAAANVAADGQAAGGENNENGEAKDSVAQGAGKKMRSRGLLANAKA